ncbi:MAG TPA: glycosyl transferase family 36 [Thermoanaerobaculia bacterium]|nr:glycosyl transferase family 36 [Thermoanaerobaculia bacterium]
MTETAFPGASAYGHFSEDGREYVITEPRTPRPWVNVVANPRAGFVVSQTGSGFSFLENSQLAVVTRWRQDLVEDLSGKFLYARDADSGELWSLSPAPVWAPFDSFACRHGLGYTTFEASCSGIEATWTLFCHAEEAVELWRVSLKNASGRPRRIRLCGALEWCCGVAPSPRREFGKLFLETRFDAGHRAIVARNHMWDVPSERFGHWNTSFPFVSAFAASEEVVSAHGDKAAFLGRYDSLRAPAALCGKGGEPAFGRHEDPIAALEVEVVLAPGEARTIGFALATSESEEAALALGSRFMSDAESRRALDEVTAGWHARLAAHRMETPDPTFDALVNDWARYQAIAARLWGRCGYYQQSGAFGFRDQLQDSQVWLTIDPGRCRDQIRLHAGHQFGDGSVLHWWHPLTEQGLATKMTDDLLWLAFVSANYMKETGDLSILEDAAPFLDVEGSFSLGEHVERAFRRVFARTSPRGIPLIGAGDWNDGLSAMGLLEKGESVWLGEFLAGLLTDWSEIHRRTGDGARAEEFAARRVALVAALNAQGWDGGWYRRGTLDDGSVLGSAENRVGRIFLNAQTWAILNDVAPPERAAACLAAVKEHLVTAAGSLLLAPAFDRPVPEIGYITRYGPGLRENGGVYTHAATWAIAAAAKAKDAALVEKLLVAIHPANKDPERYGAEPYVLPGNVDGPASPYHGRAGWTWYTGSAAWLHRVVAEWVFGVRPGWDTLTIDPCLPPSWRRARMTRPWRGGTLEIEIARGEPAAGANVSVAVDGALLETSVLAPPERPGGTRRVAATVR